METEKLPLRQAFFGLIFVAIFLAVGAIAVSASYGNTGGGSHGADNSEDADHSDEEERESDEEHSDEEGEHSDE